VIYINAETGDESLYSHVIGRVNVSDITYDVYVQDEFVFITGNKGLKIINISEPRRPKITSFFNTNDSILGIYVKDDLALIANSESGIQILDISNIMTPILLDSYDDGGKALSIAVKDDFAFIADNQQGLEIFNISNPSNIVKIGQFNDGGQAINLVIKENLAFVADAVQGIEIINITNALEPTKISTIPNTYGSWDCYIWDTILCAPSEIFGGVKIANISDLNNPYVIGQFHDGGESNNIVGQKDVFFVSDNIDGVEVVNFSNPMLPYEIGQYNTRDIAHGLFYDGKYIYLAEAAKGLVIIEFNNIKPIISRYWWTIIIGVIGIASISMITIRIIQKRVKLN